MPLNFFYLGRSLSPAHEFAIIFLSKLFSCVGQEFDVLGEVHDNFSANTYLRFPANLFHYPSYFSSVSLPCVLLLLPPRTLHPSVGSGFMLQIVRLLAYPKQFQLTTKRFSRWVTLGKTILKGGFPIVRCVRTHRPTSLAVHTYLSPSGVL